MRGNHYISFFCPVDDTDSETAATASISVSRSASKAVSHTRVRTAVIFEIDKVSFSREFWPFENICQFRSFLQQSKSDSSPGELIVALNC
jgi:hypothetical protein